MLSTATPKKEIKRPARGGPRPIDTPLDLGYKIKIINDYEADNIVKVTACDMKLAHSTASSMWKDKETGKYTAGLKTLINGHWVVPHS